MKPMHMKTETGATRYGTMTWPAADIYVGTSLRELGEFSQHEVNLLLALCPQGGTVLDIGANVGAITLPLAKHVRAGGGRVIAWEPQREIHRLLMANTRGLAVDTGRQAAGAKLGRMLAHAIDYDQRGNFGAVSFTKNPEAHDVDLETGVDTVPIVPIDLADLKHVALIKVDVEGMECDVLAGAMKTIARCRPVLYVENDRRERSAELISLLHSMGYRAWWHLPPLWNPENFKGCATCPAVLENTVSINLVALPEAVPARFDGLLEARDPALYPSLGQEGPLTLQAPVALVANLPDDAPVHRLG
jgi:FkbM family methyltransferase